MGIGKVGFRVGIPQHVKKQQPREDSVLRTSFLRIVLDDEKHLGFETVEEAAYVLLMLVIGAADTVRRVLKRANPV